MPLPDSLLSTAVLNQLQTIIALAEDPEQADFRVLEASITFQALTERTVGVASPQMWFLPKDLVGVQGSEAFSSEIKLTLKRQGMRSMTGLAEDVGAAIDVVRDAMRSLSPLREKFEATAKISLFFQVTTQGKIEFIFKAAGQTKQSHTVTLELQAVS